MRQNKWYERGCFPLDDHFLDTRVSSLYQFWTITGLHSSVAFGVAFREERLEVP